MKRSITTCLLFVLLALVVRGTSPPLASSQPPDPVAIARDHLRGNAHRYGLRPELDDLSLVETKQSRGAWHVRFRQTFRGIPVFGALTTVNISKADSHVSFVLNRYRSDVDSKVKPAVPLPLLSEEEAVGIARVAIGIGGESRAAVTAEQVYFGEEDEYVLAWQVLVPARQPLGDWLVVVQADDGRVLHKQNLVVSDSGRVFDPNPAQTSGGTIPPPSDCDSAANATLLASEYQTKTLLGIQNGQNKLRGEYVDLCAPGIVGGYKSACQANEPSRNYIYSCNDDRYEEVMVYHHVDAVQRKIQSLGFTGASAILDQPIPAHAHYLSGCQAFFSPTDGGLHFGDGDYTSDPNLDYCEPGQPTVDFAEDADVIVHEYGHALQHDQVPAWGAGYYIEETRSIGEGFGDFLAGATFDDPCIGEWANGGTCLRPLDNTKHFPEDYNACPKVDLDGDTFPESVDPHCGGLVWGGALWDLVKAFGSNQEARDLVLTLVLDSHFYLDPVATFQEAVSAVRQADLDLFAGAHVPTINSVFAARGLLAITPGVSEEWIARYKGDRVSYAAAEAIAVDGGGNVYVTGASTYWHIDTDWATLKYQPNGALAWGRRWGNYGDDVPHAIAVDSSGNVYVTGEYYDSSTATMERFTKAWGPNVDCWSREFNSDGDDANYDIVLGSSLGSAYITGKVASQTSGYDYVTESFCAAPPWKTRYDGPAHGDDVAVAMARDGAGNVWVTGYSQGVGTGFDYATVKYNASGTQVCFARYNGPGNGDDYAQALAVDSSGNAYVTGYSQGSGTGYDYATIKYGPGCNPLWPAAARYDGPAHGDDFARSLALDASNNVHVTGESAGLGTGYDYATVKYNSSGSALWPDAVRYDGPAHGDDFARSLALDASNNVFVTGESLGVGTGSDYATLKYSSAGSQLWPDAARYDGSGHGDDGAAALAVDASSNVYVTGRSFNWMGGPGYATLEYDSSGSTLWESRYDQQPGYGRDYAGAVAIDADGNAYVTGSSEGFHTGLHYLTLKYSPNGQQLWLVRDGESPGRGEAVAVDEAGNVYVSGGSPAHGTGYDYLTVAYDPNGGELWPTPKRWDGDYHGNDFVHGIAVDRAGNVYVTGETQVSTFYTHYATVGYGPTGNTLWVRTYAGFCTVDSYGVARGIAVDGDDNVYVTGAACGPDGFSHSATIKYDPNGNQLWVATYNGLGGTGSAGANAIALDPDGNVWVTGYSQSPGTGYDYATVKYNASGTQVCEAHHDGPASGYDEALALAVDSSGNAYVTGYSEGSATSYDYATVKYDANCNQLWTPAPRYNGPAGGDDRARAIAVDATGNVYVTGNSSSSGVYGYATVAYSPSGNQAWVVRYDGPGFSWWPTTDVAVDRHGKVYVVGESSEIWTSQDLVTTKYAPEADSDADGILDSVDNCRLVPNTDQMDGDGDRLGNACDNCPAAANAMQTNTDVTVNSPGDALGDACDPDDDNDFMPDAYEQAHACLRPLAPDSVPLPFHTQYNYDGDALFNYPEMVVGTDPCVANPELALQSDGDDRSDGLERYMGTDHLDACPDIVGSSGLCPGPSCDGDDCWPYDLNVNRVANILDVLLFKPVLGRTLGNPSYDRRYDLDANGSVNILDVLLYKPIISTQCTNP